MEKSLIREIQAEIRGLASPDKAKVLARFFKTGPGEYGEGDKFLGIVVPNLRKLVARYPSLTMDIIRHFLQSEFHEERLFALLCLVKSYDRANSDEREAIYSFYLDNMSCINNWDLIDISAPHIIGRHLEARSRRSLYDLAQSGNVWKRRAAIIATFHFIKRNEMTDTLEICRLLMSDKQDLIHKAAGWMLRETGKRAPAALIQFLESHAPFMPRIMLRYAIERLSSEERRNWLDKKRLD